jgi:hypothetical protein
VGPPQVRPELSYHVFEIISVAAAELHASNSCTSSLAKGVNEVHCPSRMTEYKTALGVPYTFCFIQDLFADEENVNVGST